MFSAGADMSIITWYPPREPDTPGRSSASLPSRHDEEQTRLRRHNSGSTEEPSPALLPPPSPAPALASSEGGIRTGVEHENDPGVVVHVAEVIGMAVVPGALVSADAAGRLLERGPSRHIGEAAVNAIRCTDIWVAVLPINVQTGNNSSHMKVGSPNTGSRGCGCLHLVMPRENVDVAIEAFDIQCGSPNKTVAVCKAGENLLA